MNFSCSLKENRLFQRLYRKGSSAVGGRMVVYCRRNGGRGNRLGITVSAKLGCAVERNRVRRRLREIYRLNEQRFLPGMDLVIVVRSRGIRAPYGALNAEFLSLAGKLELLREENTQ